MGLQHAQMCMRHVPFDQLQNSLAAIEADPVGNGGQSGSDTQICVLCPYCVSGRGLASLQACNLRGAFEFRICACIYLTVSI